MEDSDPTPRNKTEDKGQEETTFGQNRVNKIVSKWLAEANAKSEKHLKDEVSKALAEAERQGKLSEAEREKEFKVKQQAELNGREIHISWYWFVLVGWPLWNYPQQNCEWWKRLQRKKPRST